MRHQKPDSTSPGSAPPVPPNDRGEKVGAPEIAYLCLRCDRAHGAHMFHANGQCRTRDWCDAPGVRQERAAGIAGSGFGDNLPPRPHFTSIPLPRFDPGPILPPWAEKHRAKQARRRYAALTAKRRR